MSFLKNMTHFDSVNSEDGCAMLSSNCTSTLAMTACSKHRSKIGGKCSGVARDPIKKINISQLTDKTTS